ncbi:tetratricopeptide repeat protein, partial [Sulfurimonas sp. SAG-AH-194-I05]
MEELFQKAIKNQQNKSTILAEEQFIECLSQEYKVFEVLYNLGLLYIEKKQWKQVKTVYENILQLDPNHIES